jgi:hypothetical protein
MKPLASRSSSLVFCILGGAADYSLIALSSAAPGWLAPTSVAVKLQIERFGSRSPT